MIELLARFLAQPSATDELSVLADALTEAGDPRGELIALQLAPSTPALERKIAKLVKTHRAHLLGPLSAVVGEAEFRRGFLSRAELIGMPDQTIGDPWWSTVEHLEGEHVTAELVADMPSLRSLADTKLPVAKLATYEWLEELAVRSFEHRATFDKHGNFPALRALTTRLTYAHSAGFDFDSLLRSSIVERLSRLTIDVAIGVGMLGDHGLDEGDLEVVPRWLARLAKLPLDVTLVTVQGKVGTRYRFTRDGASVTIPRFPKRVAAELRASVDANLAVVRTLRPVVEVLDLAPAGSRS